jgi:hypothetical protein
VKGVYPEGADNAFLRKVGGFVTKEHGNTSQMIKLYCKEAVCKMLSAGHNRHFHICNGSRHLILDTGNEEMWNLTNCYLHRYL